VHKQEPIFKYKKYLSRAAIVIVVMIAVLLLISFALKGKTTVSGEYPANIKTGAIVCNKNNASYPYIDAPDSESHRMGSVRIVGTYNESKIIEKIALDFTTIFNDKGEAEVGKAYMHGEFGKRLSADDLSFSEFDNNFSLVDKKVVVSLFAPIDKINEHNYQYLLLKSKPDRNLLVNAFTQNYQGLGYNCVSTSSK